MLEGFKKVSFRLTNLKRQPRSITLRVAKDSRQREWRSRGFTQILQ